MVHKSCDCCLTGLSYEYAAEEELPGHSADMLSQMLLAGADPG